MGKYLKYKGMTVNAFGLPIIFSDNEKNDSSNQKKRRNVHHKYFDFAYALTAPKNLVVMYDIPHHQKKERDWFRRHLKKFDYIMIQKSVWVGPSPLPSEFLRYVKSIGLLNRLKTLKLAKPYSRGDLNM